MASRVVMLRALALLAVLAVLALAFHARREGFAGSGLAGISKVLGEVTTALGKSIDDLVKTIDSLQLTINKNVSGLTPDELGKVKTELEATLPKIQQYGDQNTINKYSAAMKQIEDAAAAARNKVPKPPAPGPAAQVADAGTASKTIDDFINPKNGKTLKDLPDLQKSLRGKELTPDDLVKLHQKFGSTDPGKAALAKMVVDLGPKGLKAWLKKHWAKVTLSGVVGAALAAFFAADQIRSLIKEIEKEKAAEKEDANNANNPADGSDIDPTTIVLPLAAAAACCIVMSSVGSGMYFATKSK